MVNRKEFQQRAQVIEALVRKIDGVSDPDLRASTKELLQALMALHGAGLERMMEIVHQSGEPGGAGRATHSLSTIRARSSCVSAQTPRAAHLPQARSRLRSRMPFTTPRRT